MIWIIFFLEIVAFAAYCEFSARKKKQERKLPADEEMAEMPKKKSLGELLHVTIIILSVLIIAFTGFIALLKLAVIREHWTTFSPDRVRVIENNSGITIDSTVKLIEYTEKFGGPDGPAHVLRFECSRDMAEFAEKNCGGYITSYEKDGSFYVYNEETEKFEVWGTSDEGVEIYTIKGRHNKMQFEKKNGIYTIFYPNWRKIDSHYGSGDIK